MRPSIVYRQRERGVAILELAVITPVLLVILLGMVDASRMIYTAQKAGALSRGAASMVARGYTAADAFDATAETDEPLDVLGEGRIFISTIRRKSVSDGTPWIFEQASSGGLNGASSHVGTAGGPANLPELDQLELGMTLTAVEISYPFQPLFPIATLGLDVFPDTIYRAAYF